MSTHTLFRTDLGTGRRILDAHEPGQRYLLGKMRHGQLSTITDDSGLIQVETMTTHRGHAEAEIAGGQWVFLQVLRGAERANPDLWPVPEPIRELQRAAMRGERRGEPRSNAALEQFIAQSRGVRLLGELEQAIEIARDPDVPKEKKPVMPLAKLEKLHREMSGGGNGTERSASKNGGAVIDASATKRRGGRRRGAARGASTGE